MSSDDDTGVRALRIRDQKYQCKFGMFGLKPPQHEIFADHNRSDRWPDGLWHPSISPDSAMILILEIAIGVVLGLFAFALLADWLITSNQNRLDQTDSRAYWDKLRSRNYHSTLLQ
jgi:hypothetical protein